jgi:MFS family permease
MYLGVFFVGSIFSAFLTLGMINWNSEYAWRVPTLLQISGTIVISIYIMCGFMPESPRWQLRHGQGAKALKTLAKLHANGDENDELVRYEFAEMEESLAADEGAKSVSYLEFFKTAGNRRRLLVTCVVAAGAQLGGNTLTSYYLAPILRLIGITEPPRQAGINAGLSVWGLVCVMTAAQFIDRLGRRALWMQGLIGMLVWFSFITALSVSLGRWLQEVLTAQGAFAETKSQAIGTA